MTIQLDFEPRALSVPPDLRLYRRLAMLCVSLSKCISRNTATFEQLHFINALYIDDKFRRQYFEFKSNPFAIRILSPSADPYLNRCVNYAIGSGLVGQKRIKKGFRVALLPSGMEFVRQLQEQKLVEDIFSTSHEIGKISGSEIHRALNLRK